MRRIIPLLLLALLSISALAYLPAGDADAGGVRDMVLIPLDTGAVWEAYGSLPYVAYVTPDNQVIDWLFDASLFWAVKTPEGVDLGPTLSDRLASRADWEWFIKELFHPKMHLAGFSGAMKIAHQRLFPRDLRVVLMIPYPQPQQKRFGSIATDGPTLDFSQPGDRILAVEWYLQTILKEWQDADLPYLHLAGFAWSSPRFHPMNPGEMELIQATAQLLAREGLSFFWLPSYQATGHSEWEELGFHAALLDPEYITTTVGRGRLQEAAGTALEYRMGMTMTIDGSTLASRANRDRFLEFFRQAQQLGYNRSVMAYRQEVFLFRTMAFSPDPEVRALYDTVYAMMRARP